MFIVNRSGVVHRLENACMTLLTSPRRVPVSRNQAMVFKLPACDHCWPGEDVYRGFVGLPRGK